MTEILAILFKIGKLGGDEGMPYCSIQAVVADKVNTCGSGGGGMSLI